ncbi:hypothetical protein EAO73_03605 [Streptomyces sp. col6]|uniref:hypothetical protein n=1 Tax=Streptomyces sp. col6 TaxID=2478958 RepID=UPI0011CD917F|nr:hypothetical protein [Streptomyces sp. col6]TXS06924.1 hypothetical protein EAO73_03605 [Streptomyces sp. col6]
MTTHTKSDAPDTARTKSDAPDFASASVPRHLARGAAGFGSLIASVALIPVTGPLSLLLLPAGVLALRGCPMCWAIGLAQTISRGRLRRDCEDGVCSLRVAERADAGRPVGP